MKKILYLMGIDWYWIKQRPQIIAEMLNKDYDVTVAYYKELFVKQSLRKNNDELEKNIEKFDNSIYQFLQSHIVIRIKLPMLFRSFCFIE